MDVKGVDKRNQSTVTNITYFLFKMFEFANKNNTRLVLPTRSDKSVKLGIGKGKKITQV